MPQNLNQLLERMRELKDLSGIIGLLTWDQETYLPPKAHTARGEQLSTLQGLYHEKLTEPSLGELLDEMANAKGASDDSKAMARALRHERQRAVNVPTELVRALAEAQARAISAWKEARAQLKFELFAEPLSELLNLRRQQADAIGHSGQRYDALLDNFEPGMTVARLTPVLSALKKKLTALVETLTNARKPRRELFKGYTFDVDRQWRLSVRILEDMGFDFGAGRQDKSIHPFTGGTHPLDVRLTTRLDEADPLSALFSTIHEGGHGLYEQGFSPEHHRTPLAAAPSMGLHESQSRLWENIVGRSRPFWQHYYPLLAKEFPQPFSRVSLDEFHAAVNEVTPSLIRVDADEVTYNLHIVLRYELELSLLDGALPVSELPAEWNRRMKEILGVSPANDLEGVLQDIHWAWGEFGYFPTYALGNLYSASLFAALKREVPQVEASMSQGQLSPILDWLRQRIHRQGFRWDAEKLLEKVTGRGLTDEDFLQYLKTKYAPLYNLSL